MFYCFSHKITALKLQVIMSAFEKVTAGNRILHKYVSANWDPLFTRKHISSSKTLCFTTILDFLAP